MIARSRPGRRVTAVVFVAALAAACGTAPATAPPESLVPPATASPVAATVAPASPSPAAQSLLVDQALLQLLPATVAGHALEGAPEAAAESASDPGLAQHFSSLAVAIAADPGLANFVVASVVKLKPGVFDDELYRDWRDSFDEGVCAQAGGVAGNAEATIDGRTVHIGTCVGGVHTYHVHLEEPGVIVSLNDVGEARLGEELMATLPD